MNISLQAVVLASSIIGVSVGTFQHMMVLSLTVIWIIFFIYKSGNDYEIAFSEDHFPSIYLLFRFDI